MTPLYGTGQVAPGLRRFIVPGARVLTLAFVMGAAFTPVPVAASGEQQDPEESSAQFAWGPHAESRVYGVSYIEEDEPDGTTLQGVSVLWSNWDETIRLFNGGFGLWLAAQEGDSQTVLGGGVEVSLTPWVPRAPLRFGPRFRFGLEHRSRDPDDGFGGLFAVGVEAALWIGRSVQIAVTVDRELLFPADDRTQVGVAFRLARSRY